MGNPKDPSSDSADPADTGAGPARDAVDRELSSLTRQALRLKHGALPNVSDVDDEQLLRYFDGALSAAERASFERRLIADHDAKERLGILAVGFDEAGISRQRPPTTTGITRAASSVSRYVFHVAGGLLELLRGGEGASVLQPAMAVRGTSQPSAFAVEREFQTAHGALSARFELHAERAGAPAAALVDLVVHVGADGNPAEGVRCKLLREGRPIDSREVEHNGCTFSRLGPARYDVELRKGGVEVGRVQFNLRG